MNHPVMQALIGAKVSEMIEPPRSWGHVEKLAFLNLPPDLQRFYVKREADRDREVRRCQTELAKARKALVEAQKALEEARTAKPEERHEDQQVHDRAH